MACTITMCSLFWGPGANISSLYFSTLRRFLVTSSRGCRYGACYEDASDLSATSRACRARGIWRTTRHTDRRAALHRSRPPADQSGKRVVSWTGKSPDTPDTRDILTRILRGCRACRACRTRLLRGCYEETAPVECKFHRFACVQRWHRRTYIVTEAAACRASINSSSACYTTH